MTNPIFEESDRRAALRRMIGLAVAPVGLPMLGQLLSVPLIAPAYAQYAIHPADVSKGNVVHIPAAAARTTMTAEWNTGLLKGNDFRIAESKAAFEKAPANAARFEAKLYNFPSGNFRRMTYKAGGPVLHQITHETEIYILAGSATLSPFPGFPGKPMTIRAGDALFLPAGIISNPKASEDFVMLQGFVNRTVREAKSAIITSRQATTAQFAEWQADGKDIRAETPAEIRKAPKTAHRITTRRYQFDGNAILAVTLSGGRSNTTMRQGDDQLVYVVSGRVRRTEGDQTFELAPGDAARQKIGNSGHWEPLEQTLVIATPAPLKPGMMSPAALTGQQV
jgi:quercetin dioxygenase-like cupin family protein